MVGPTDKDMIEIRQAKIEDAVRVSSLLMTNSSERGGALYGDWSIGVVTKWITGEALIAFAIDGSKLLGVLFTSEKAQASAEPVVKMLRAWPGTADAYVYGPVCIEEAARGQGVLESLFEYVAAIDYPAGRPFYSSKRTISARYRPMPG